MKIAGEAKLQAPIDKVWDALLDPAVLVRTIPGCEKLETTGENSYAMTVTAGVAAIKGTYAGTCRLTDLRPRESLVLSAQGAGAPGTIAADVLVRFGDNGDGTTRLSYDADAIVGGMIGGVGQRMLTSVSKRMAGEFFGNVDGVLTGTVAESAGAAAPVAVSEGADGAAVYAAPPRAASASSTDDLLKGALVGAGLVLAGVIAGALAARRRR
ncbi:SRPBCC family protein [Nocardioides speluncae]|uniref:SRPBCC family protein n=1 Tax=Nocardioides speluncae TaxID=2670337 RepID=UPI000D69EAAF|nr:carbon monoxide dehydrogenase subunit G [Nocardioides speluncae]